jgi:hypothetical protein
VIVFFACLLLIEEVNWSSEKNHFASESETQLNIYTKQLISADDHFNLSLVGNFDRANDIEFT